MKTVVIDCFPESIARYRAGYAVVAVDVIRATTTAISAVAGGRRCFVAPSIEAARELATRLGNALLVGEQRGLLPPGFDINNSPSELSARTDIERPAILLSSSGTRLCHAASLCDAAFLACFRNDMSIAAHLAAFPKVAVIGAGSRNEFRDEDQLCCARIADRLLAIGYRSADRQTDELIGRWRDVPPSAVTAGKSAAYLRDSGQLADLDFILANIGDLTAPFMMRGDEVVMDGVAARGEMLVPAA
jgi:2-phosphosulfolactate phosphatase